MSMNDINEFDFGNDPEFQEKFYKNIEKAISDIEIDEVLNGDSSGAEATELLAAADIEQPSELEEEAVDTAIDISDIPADKEAVELAYMLSDAEADETKTDGAKVEEANAEAAVDGEENTDEAYAVIAGEASGNTADTSETGEAADKPDIAVASEKPEDFALNGESSDETTGNGMETTETAALNEDGKSAEAASAKEDAESAEAASATDDAKSAEADAAKDNAESSETGEQASTDTAEASNGDTEENLDEAIIDINNSLAKQIGEELENLEAIALKRKKRIRTMKIQIGVIAALLAFLGFACFLGFTDSGNKLLLKMGLNLGGLIWETSTQDFDKDPVMEEEDTDYVDDEDLASDSEEIDPEDIEWPNSTGYGRREDGVYNILLLGEEAIDSGSARGRTDLMIIATLNKNSKSIKLTSLMRDMLVQIPGYRENKLNSAYQKGDVQLLYETIALNFNLHIDGSILVNFENFEKIIDYLGGLEITLTAAEAKYLRNTNYISNPKYRTVVEGKQLMNGNQVLGYARIRERAAITGANNDYGRTDRHRIILEAIFEKYKSKSEVELLLLMTKMLPLVKTDIDSKTFEKLVMTYFEMGGVTEIEQLRIPADGTFRDNVKVREMDVLIPDLVKNIEILHEFIFED